MKRSNIIVGVVETLILFFIFITTAQAQFKSPDQRGHPPINASSIRTGVLATSVGGTSCQQTIGLTFSQLPNPPQFATQCVINDCRTGVSGAVELGGGSIPCSVQWLGSNWIDGGTSSGGSGGGSVITGSQGQGVTYNSAGTTVSPSSTRGVDASGFGMIGNEINAVGSMTSNSATLTATSSIFTSNMCTGGSGCTGTSNYTVCVDRAGTNFKSLCTTILSYLTSTQVNLNASANSTGVSGVTVALGFDNTTALNNAVAAASLQVSSSNPYAGLVNVPPGRFMFCGALSSGLCSGFLSFTTNGVSMLGAGIDATKFFLAGFSSANGNHGCGVTSAHPDDSAQMLIDGNNVEFGRFTLYSLNNNSDCTLYVGHTGATPTAENLHDIRILNTESTINFQTAVAGQQNPIGLFVKTVFNDIFNNFIIGPQTTQLTSNGFREDVYSRASQSSTYSNFNVGPNESNIGLTTPVIFDSNPELDFGGGGGNGFISEVDCDYSLVCFWNGGTSNGSLSISGVQGGDNSEINSSFVQPYPAEWEPKAIYTAGQFVIPVATPITISSCSSSTVCTPASTTGLYVGQRVILPGAGALASIDWAATHTYASSSSATLPGTVILPTVGNAGHYLFQVTALGTAGAISSGSEPTWPQTLGQTVTDGSGTTQFTWTNEGAAPLSQAWPSASGSDVFYITVITAGGVLTFDHATTATPTTLVYRNYAGHVFRAEGTQNTLCFSGSTQPSWSTTTWPISALTTTADTAGTTPCTWMDYGPGAFLINNATAGQVRFDNITASEGYFGVLNQSSGGSAASITNSFIQAQIDGITNLSGGSLAVSGSSFNGSGKAGDFLFTDSGSSGLYYDSSNFVYGSSNAIQCPITNNGTPNSTILTSQKMCGSGAPTLGGTTAAAPAGTGVAYCRQDNGSAGSKTAVCFLSGYAETSTAQTWTYPTAYTSVPLVMSTGCGASGTGIASTASTLTLPSGASMSAGSCEIVVIGQ